MVSVDGVWGWMIACLQNIAGESRDGWRLKSRLWATPRRPPARPPETEQMLLDNTHATRVGLGEIRVGRNRMRSERGHSGTVSIARMPIRDGAPRWLPACAHVRHQSRLFGAGELIQCYPVLACTRLRSRLDAADVVPRNAQVSAVSLALNFPHSRPIFRVKCRTHLLNDRHCLFVRICKLDIQMRLVTIITYVCRHTYQNVYGHNNDYAHQCRRQRPSLLEEM